MTLVLLPNVYCTPQDVYDRIGLEAAQLRLDDQNAASGQQVATTAAASSGAVSLTVAAIQYPMLRGTQLSFSDAAMETPVTVTLNAAAAAGATTLTVVALSADIPSGAVAFDNGLNTWLAGQLLTACQRATARCKLYLCNRYNDSALAQSWSVNQWSITIAAKWLATRCFRAAPQQIQDEYEEAMEEMKAVKNSQLNIEDIGTRTSGWPFLSNVTVDLTYTYAKVRVESCISEPTQTQYPQSVDWNSMFVIEF